MAIGTATDELYTEIEKEISGVASSALFLSGGPLVSEILVGGHVLTEDQNDALVKVTINPDLYTDQYKEFYMDKIKKLDINPIKKFEDDDISFPPFTGKLSHLRLIQNMYNLKPEEMMLIDDSPANLKSAEIFKYSVLS